VSIYHSSKGIALCISFFKNLLEKSTTGFSLLKIIVFPKEIHRVLWLSVRILTGYQRITSPMFTAFKIISNLEQIHPYCTSRDSIQLIAGMSYKVKLVLVEFESDFSEPLT